MRMPRPPHLHMPIAGHKEVLCTARTISLHPCTRAASPHLWLEVPMDVSQLVQLVDTRKHLGRVEPRVFFLEYARVVEQRAEVATGDVFLRVARVSGDARVGACCERPTIARYTWSRSWNA